MKKIILFITACVLLASQSKIAAQPTVGLMYSDAGSYGGYSLFAPNGGKVTYLVDACGREVNSWPSDYTPGLSAYLLEDGSLLRACRLPGLPSPTGGGRIERRDWDNNLIWSYEYSGATYRQHHDIRMMPNGNVLLLARESKTKAECIAKGRDPALLLTNGLQMEYIVEVQPSGDSSGIIVWEWHVWDHLIQDFDSTQAGYGVVSDHPELLDINNSTSSIPDWLHCNAVVYNPDLDQIIFNSRNQSEFWIIDHATTSAEAAGHSGGAHGRGGDFMYRWGNPANYDRGTIADQQLWLQHDAHWIEPGLSGEGQILIFNNGDGRPTGDYSTVVSIQPPVDSLGDYPLAPGMAWGPAAPAWVYQAPMPTDFYSLNVSNAQRLPNGNTHICEGANGRIFEVDSTGNIHWEYVIPLSSGSPIVQGDAPTFNAAFRSYRYGPDYPGLAGRDLTPGEPIEIDPLPLSPSCLALSSTESSLFWSKVFPNPFSDELNISAPVGSQFQLLNMWGQVMMGGKTGQMEVSLQTDVLPAGIYLMQVQWSQSNMMFRVVRD